MKAFDVVLAILREWPGTEDRLNRLAVAKGVRWYSKEKSRWVDLRDKDELMRKLSHPAADNWERIVTDYFRQWASSFMSEPLDRLTNEELSIRLAVAERVLVESDAEVGAIVTPEQDGARREYDLVAHEIARRDAR